MAHVYLSAGGNLAAYLPAYLKTMFRALYGWFVALLDRNDDGELGAGDVEEIIQAAYAKDNQGFVNDATIGEPEIYDNGTQYAPDPQIEIPLRVEGHPDPAPLIFDVPSGPFDVDADLLSLLSVFGYQSIDELGEIVGETLPVEVRDNAIVASWGGLVPDRVTFVNEGSEEDPHTERAITEIFPPTENEGAEETESDEDGGESSEE